MFVFVCVLQRGVEVGKDRRLPTFVTSLKPKKRIRGFINTGSLTKLAQMFGNHVFCNPSVVSSNLQQEKCAAGQTIPSTSLWFHQKVEVKFGRYF